MDCRKEIKRSSDPTDHSEEAEGEEARPSGVHQKRGSLVPEEVVWELTARLGEGREAGKRRKRRGLELSLQLVRTLAATGGAVSWEVLRKLAHSTRATRIAEASRSRGAALALRKYENRVRRLRAENEMLERSLESVLDKCRQTEEALELERSTRSEQRALYSKIIHQNKERRDVKTQTYAADFIYDTETLSRLLTELRHVKDLYMKQKLLTASICEKYVKVREGKEKLSRRLSRLEDHYRAALEEAMILFDRDRAAFALVERDGRLGGKAHQELASRCATLSFNNAALHSALLRVRAKQARAAPKDALTDLSMYSLLKDTNKLARYEERMKKLEGGRKESFQEMLFRKKGYQEKFIRLPLVVDDEEDEGSYKEVPLFEMVTEEDSRSEREEEEEEGGKDEEDTLLFSRSVESGVYWRKGRQASSSDLGYKSGSSETSRRTWSCSSQLGRAFKEGAEGKRTAPDIIQAVPTGFRIT